MLTLAARNLSLRYAGREEWALKDVSVNWRQAESILLIGAAGSGKSSLGKVFKGLLAPDSGRIEIIDDNRTSNALPDKLLTMVGWADAQPERQIFASTVWEEVAFGPQQRGLPSDEVSRQVRKALEVVGLNYDRFKERDPLMLSGGEKRRVGLAAAISTPAKFYVLDEPVAGLDSTGIKCIRDMTWKLSEEAAGVIVISHDHNDFRDLVDTVWLMEAGRLIKAVSAREADWEKINHWLESGGIYE